MRSSPLINTGQAWDYSGAIIRIKNSTMSFDTQPPKLLRLNQELRENTVRQREGAEGTRPYLDGGGFVKTNVLDIVHDLWITLKGLQKSATRFGNGPLLTFLLQVIHKDIVILFSLWGKKEKQKTQKWAQCSHLIIHIIPTCLHWLASSGVSTDTLSASM